MTSPNAPRPKSLGRLLRIAVAALVFAASPAYAQYPSKPVRIILQFPAGGVYRLHAREAQAHAGDKSYSKHQ